jgi:YccS/YhfK family integral membrane protein
MKMHRQANEIRYFLFSQGFADGLRMTLAILLPALVAAQLGYFNIGLIISLGALCVSLTDAPGPTLNRRNGMLFCCCFIFLVATATLLVRHNTLLLGLEIAVFSFLFSMFNVYGNRAAAVGNAAILVMIFTMDDPAVRGNILLHSGLIVAGGLFYLLMSLILNQLQPYRPAERALGESIRSLADYLSFKANFYDPSTDLQENYRKLVAQQIIVHEKQDAVRELMFKTRQIVRESTRTGRNLVLTFVDSIDLFEDITATYYDYTEIRKKYAETGTLQKISGVLREMAAELNRIGIAIQSRDDYRLSNNYEEQLTVLKTEIDALSTPASGNLVLKKILVNLRRLVQHLNELNKFFIKEERQKRKKSGVDHGHFVTHQPLDVKSLASNLNFRSAIFRHSLRVCIACIAGYAVVKVIDYGAHSYWILLTIAFILKPAFSLTKQRNVERITGTLIGGAVGILILYFIPNKNVLFAFLVLFMLLNYSFMRTNYLMMVMCVTPFVLILFSFLGMGFSEVAQERVLDTVIGCAIAFTASYFLFPSWESESIKTFMENMIRANKAYLQKILDSLHGRDIKLLEYKLTRKEVYVSSANLSAAFQRMLSEPRSKQKNSKRIHQFVVLNHILFSNIATVATTLLRKEARVHSHTFMAPAKKALHKLDEAVARLNPEIVLEKPVNFEGETPTAAEGSEDLLLKDQLEFIYKLSADISKTVGEAFKE